MLSKLKQPIRVRIAPSPTGFLHIGTARTALFNWLFAKKYGGAFVLRIEDTDLERSDSKYETDIIESLKWLGLEWDEGPLDADQRGLNADSRGKFTGEFGPYRQSERLEIYEKYIKKLLDEKLAYYCYCDKEELEAERQALLAQGFPPKYSGKCRSTSSRQVRLASKHQGKPQVIRFIVPEIKLTFKDLIRGDISFDTGLIGDIAIAKDLHTPLYNFAVVIDDFEMKISHVIRGEDHIANTPKQILIQKALGFSQPEYAHLPLILDPDRSKMSKRYSATSINEYKKEGYLSEALINFMVLLGWHPQDDKEIMSREELIEKFDLGRTQKAGAVFNVAKLEWINGQYIKSLTDEQLFERLEDFGVDTKNLPERQFLKIIALIKERMKTLSEFNSLADFFFKLPDYSPRLLIWKNASQEKILKNLEMVLALVPDKQKITALAEKEGRGEVLWPLRVALSGKEFSPGPLEIMDALGEKETIQRIAAAIQKLKS
ncbi:MAG: glutamate--tRNA ligase [Candidatus Harrisonbacteria bacterium RIFCSPHIGHO2_01_FULL_44_13]|uniref:Glutamate--tRNA ligase n=1 Tax=Candidatus Harrisonbacteria bacterium RIFCSPLOWO2_01_FULL_44_18 TaxID=1798407 RepID=A0A1G1ZMY4_9BACT|nr:MAG: glutamate--tRNA ligase [Candidatus Harrisonbacteria bacterium RIFCSPHIGHO2_01_FULL_44_13]OGY66013.1 MAG: glutamate--tRNA ligase [Candidatus Harrisonbacteria bacterium RIFCSPLOWO2_01_FULL_44_18]